MKEIKREACGVSDCIFNEHFRCTKDFIIIDDSSKCLDVRVIISVFCDC